MDTNNYQIRTPTLREESLLAVANPSVTETLLLIGNVESNPGPGMTEERIMAELILGAPDDITKKILSKYKTKAGENANYAQLKSAKVEGLRKVLAYLMNWKDEEGKSMTSKYLKEGLIIVIMKRLKNLMPSSCGTCKSLIYFLPSDECDENFKCIKCERNMCNSCIDQNSSYFKAASTFGTSTFHVCLPCVDMIRSDSALGPECTRKDQEKPEALNNEQSVSVIDIGNTNKPPDKSTEKPSYKSTVKPANKSTEVPEVIETDESVIIDDSTDFTETDKQAVPNSNGNDNMVPNVKKDCFHFTKHNNCRFGMSGKGCDFNHPKVCNQNRLYGNGRYGCKKGDQCKFFHQRICRNASKEKICLNEKCSFIHPKGTTRRPHETTKSQDRNQGSNNNNNNNIHKKSPFLGQHQTEIWKDKQSTPFNQNRTPQCNQCYNSTDQKSALNNHTNSNHAQNQILQMIAQTITQMSLNNRQPGRTWAEVAKNFQ